MNAVTKMEDNGSAVTEYGGGILSVIERALANPNTGIDALERLLAMQERVQERQAKASYTLALREMQPKLPIITERGRIIIKEKGTDKVIQDTSFARWEDINEEIRPLLAEHGFALNFSNGLSPDGKVRVTTLLKHIGGWEESTYFDLPHDSSGSKNAVQAVGSSTSYAKRYGTLSILNITTKGEDDDGHSAIPPQVIVQDTPSSPAKDGKKPLPPGKHTSRQSLTNAIRKLKLDGEKVVDIVTFERLVTEHAADLAQLEADQHQWWTATDFESVPAWLARRRGELSRGYSSMMDRLNGCETKLQLAAFLDANLDDIDAMDGEDRRRFDAEYEAREAAINLMDRSVS